MGLSGETPIEQCIVDKGKQLLASEVAQINVKKRQYQKAYLDYWQSTIAATGTGRPVDGVLCAAAPHAAVIPAKYRYIGYSSFVNVLDYTSAIIPVTTADQTVDDVLPIDDFLSKTDELVRSECEFPLYDIKARFLNQSRRRRYI